MRSLTQLDLDEIAALRARGEYFWLDLHDAEDDTVTAVEELFALDPMAVEDSREFGQRPKVDDYGDHVLVVSYGMEGDELVEVHLYITGEAIVTLRHGHCSTLANAHQRLARVDTRSEEEAVYRVLDALTDSFLPRLHALDERVDEVQDAAVTYQQGDLRERVLELRRELGAIRRVVLPQRDMLPQLGAAIDRLPGLSGDEAQTYFRDIHDHLILIAETVEHGREQLTTALDLHASAVSERANAVSERLTLIATIFLPLTFVSGFFGMNFGWLVDGIDSAADFLVLGVGGCLLALVLLGVSLVRGGILRRDR